MGVKNLLSLVKESANVCGRERKHMFVMFWYFICSDKWCDLVIDGDSFANCAFHSQMVRGMNACCNPLSIYNMTKKTHKQIEII